MTNNREQNNWETSLKRLHLGGKSLLLSPPEITSEKFEMELELLESIGKKLKEEDKDTILEYDNNVLNQYIHILNQFSLEFDRKELKELSEDIGLIVKEEKKKHNRPRPIDAGKAKGIMINEQYQLYDSPSYPSLHATESMFMSLYLADSFPLYKNVFLEMSTNISNSRLLSSSNYPTDNLAGQTLAHVLYNKYKEEIKGQKYGRL